MNKFEYLRESLNNELSYAEQSVEDARKNVLLVAESKTATADEIIAWAQNMKRAEARVSEIKAKINVVDTIVKGMEA